MRDTYTSTSASCALKETVYWPELNEQLVKTSVKLSVMSQILSIQVQATLTHVTGTRNSDPPMDQACY